jgi:hypothetical protein
MHDHARFASLPHQAFGTPRALLCVMAGTLAAGSRG